MRGKRIYIILFVVCILAVGACVYMNIVYRQMTSDEGETLESLKNSVKQFEKEKSQSDFSLESASYDIDGKEDHAKDTSVDSTNTDNENSQDFLDFEGLWEINPEIYGWIEIKGTKIDYPILQSSDDDKKYLKTSFSGTPYVGGAIFTESTYNGRDFNDPVTVIYGHTMRSGIMFGRLQATYSDPKSFEKHKEITVYLPNEVRNYTVFAAVPYSNIHLLYTYDFENTYWYNNFFKNVGRIRAIGANFDEAYFPRSGERVIILSVCLNEDTTSRYLVMAVLNDDISNR